MLKPHNPTTIAPPFSNYAHGVEVPAGARWLYVSGQLGVAPDGVAPEDFTGQKAAISNFICNLAGILAKQNSIFQLYALFQKE